MTDRAVAIPQDAGKVMEQVIVKGDLKDLSPQQRAEYYMSVCRSVGLNPLVQPFQYITLSGRLTLYATRTATDQLRKLHNVSITIVARERQEDVYIVTARATMPDGRCDESIGAVTIGGLKGDALANCLMKSETKAKRRATLAIVGLGWLDESEVETIPGARVEPAVVAAEDVGDYRSRFEAVLKTLPEVQQELCQTWRAEFDAARIPADLDEISARIVKRDFTPAALVALRDYRDGRREEVSGQPF